MRALRHNVFLKRCVRHARFLIVPGLLCIAECSLFDTREPEDPTQTSSRNRPPDLPEIVMANLTIAVEEKNIANYADCFANPATSSHEFVFTPTGDALTQYPGVLDHWTYEDERNYFQNLITKTGMNRISQLSLTPRDSILSSDSVIYTFDYFLFFDHTEPGFERTAQGSAQFTIGKNSNNKWAIYRWIDFRTVTTGITWSYFKGKFGG
jgi:hypothetical protein